MKCSFCSKIANFKCTCILPYLCQSHLGSHLSEAGMHPFEPFDMHIENSKLNILKSKVKEIIQNLRNSKTDLTLKTRSLIGGIENLYSKRLKELNSLINYYGEIHQLSKHSKFCKSELLKIDKILEKKISVNNISIDSIIKKKIYRAYSTDILHTEKFYFGIKGTVFEYIEYLETVSVRNENIKKIVYKGKSQLIERFVAIKEVIAPHQEDLKPFLHEAEVYRKLSGASNNFLIYYGQNLTTINIGNAQKFKFELMMEFVEKTLKDDKIERMYFNKPYSEDEITHIYDQLIEAYNIMRQIGILHCDIKPSNILITSDSTIKIIDFNIARKNIQEYTQNVGAFGTLDFMAPEIREGREKSCMASLKEDKADVFSLGMTILYLLVNKPVKNLNLLENENELMELIENIKWVWLKNILKEMLKFNYQDRVSLKDLILHRDLIIDT